MTSPLIEAVEVESVEEFLAVISPHHAFWTSKGGAHYWMFRGQSDAKWTLTPTALRRSPFRYYGIGTKAKRGAKNVGEQLKLEHEALQTFITECVQCGLPLPEDSQWFRDEKLVAHAFRRLNKDVGKGKYFPHPLLRSLYALAQHHGVPTRLLDWSADPAIAAYFACVGAARKACSLRQGERGGRLALFALWHLAWDSDRVTGDPHIERVEAPYRDNPNLAAQKGAFTLVTYQTKAPTERALPTIEAVLAREERRRRSDVGDGPYLRKITLPIELAPDVLRRLYDAHVCRGTVFPSYDSARATIEEREFWALPSRRRRTRDRRVAK